MLPLALIAALAGPLAAAPLPFQVPEEATGARITVATLLAELASPRALSEFPRHPYQTRLASSRDPASVAPGAQGWFADDDRGHFQGVFETEGRREDVLLSTAGPGALVRLWCAESTGVLRVYVDGRPQAVLTAPLAELMAGAAGVPAPLAQTCGGAGTLLLPIPFEASCRVTCTGAEDLAYQLTYRAWEPGAPVTSFEPGDLEAYALELAQAVTLLTAGTGSTEGEVMHPFGHKIASTGKDGAAIYAGLSNDTAGTPSAVTELRIAVRDADPGDGADLTRLLREALLILTFDGVDTVRVPLGAFFGSSPGLNPFESRFLSVQASEEVGLLTTRFAMPFRRSLFVRVESLCPEPMDLKGYVTLAPYQWTPQTLYFHANWRGERDVAVRPARDWPLASLEGRGLLIGDALSFSNPVEADWRGGDTKIRVDAEAFPSSFGTGTADYFGCGEASLEPFATLFFGRTLSGGPGHSGTWSHYRLRTLDAVPFFAQLDLERELLHASDEEDLRADLSATTWFYASLGASSEATESVRTSTAVEQD